MDLTFLGVPEAKLEDITEGTIVLIGSTIVSKSEHEPYGQDKSADVIRKCSMEYTGFLDYAEKSMMDWDVVDLGNYGKDALGEVVRGVIESGGLPIVFGGDHTTTFYALEKLNKPDVLTVLDAHFDFADQRINPDAEEISHGFINKLLIKKGWSIKIYGTRAYSSFPQEYWIAKEKNAEIIPWFGNESLLTDALQKARFLSIDMDFFDLSSFPATRVPEIGGATLREFVKSLRDIKKFAPKYIDLVEYAPDLDETKAYGKAVSILIMELIGTIMKSRN
ncbi:MAG: arginase family protein [Candidatus Njordarchaeia archaeon]